MIEVLNKNQWIVEPDKQISQTGSRQGIPCTQSEQLTFHTQIEKLLLVSTREHM
jgi:hypothetical protein